MTRRWLKASQSILAGDLGPVRRVLTRKRVAAASTVSVPAPASGLEARIVALSEKYREATMIPAPLFLDNLRLCAQIAELAGVVVECGVWRGGMSAAMAEVLGPGRTYYLFDSFDGLPAADPEKDGHAAVQFMANVGRQPMGRLATPRDAAEAVMRQSGARTYHLMQGWFKDTVPLFTPPGPLAVLRLDGDWYESTMTCLTALYPHVQAGGLILIDDYYVWDGCTRAVHEYLAQQSVQERIRQSPAGAAYILKGS